MTPNLARRLATAELADGNTHIYGIGQDPCPPSRSRPWIGWRQEPDGHYHHASYGWGMDEEETIRGLAGTFVNLLRAGHPVSIEDPRLQAEVDAIHAMEAEAKARKEREFLEAHKRRRVEMERREKMLADTLAQAHGKMATVSLALAKGKEPVRAWTYRGLAVHRTLKADLFTVTHIATGLAFGHRFPSQAMGKVFAVRACEIADWEKIATAKEAEKAIKGKALDRMKALLADTLTT